MRLRLPSFLVITPLLALLAGCAADGATGPNQTEGIVRTIRPNLATAALEGGCPSEFYLTSADESTKSRDHNGDGVLCILVVYTPDGKLHTYIDNNIPFDEKGVCPPNFDESWVMRSEVEEETPDRNGNGIVCQLTKPDGSTVTIDDNYKG